MKLRFAFFLTILAMMLMAVPAMATGPGGMPAGKGTIGIVCHGADGEVQAIQPLAREDIRRVGVDTIVQGVVGHLRAQMPEVIARNVSCGMEQLGSKLLNAYNQWGPLAPFIP